MLQVSKRQARHQRVAMQPGPRATLEVVEAEFLLELLMRLAQAAAPSLSRVRDPFSGIEAGIRCSSGSDPAALKDTAVTAMRAAVSGDEAQQAAAQDKAVQALAKAQNVPVEQARTQVAQYTQQFKETVAATKEQSKEVADAAARRVSQGALLGSFALILGGWPLSLPVVGRPSDPLPSGPHPHRHATCDQRRPSVRSRCRLTLARDMLIDGKSRVGEAVLRIGCESDATFSVSHKAMFGHPPRDKPAPLSEK